MADFCRMHETAKKGHRMSRARTLGLASVATTSVIMALTFGCGGGQSRGGTSGGDEGDGFRGDLTVENRSSHDVCRIRLDMAGDARFVEDVDLPSGGSTTIAISGAPERLIITECGNERSLFGNPLNFFGSAIGDAEYPSDWTHERLVLHDAGDAPQGDFDSLALNPRPMSEWLFFTESDPALSSTFHELLVAHASQAGWSETFERTWSLNEWNVQRNQRTGIILGRTHQAVGFARWSDGHCTMQVFGFAEGHDGSSFDGNVRFDGTSTQLPIPCAILDHASGGGEASDAATGGSCSNTCDSASDGECDDGGPGAAYSVCELGTDCADCGAR